jgi:hypothetical protein
VDSITTGRTWTSTIRVTLERSECGISTSRATTSGSQLSTWTRYVQWRFIISKAMGMLHNRRTYRDGKKANPEVLGHGGLPFMYHGLCSGRGIRCHHAFQKEMLTPPRSSGPSSPSRSVTSTSLAARKMSSPSSIYFPSATPRSLAREESPKYH